MTFLVIMAVFPRKRHLTTTANGRRDTTFWHLSPKKTKHGPIVCFTMEFRPRNYSAEKQAHALPRVRADDHPLSAPSSLPPLQVPITSVIFSNFRYFVTSAIKHLFGCIESVGNSDSWSQLVERFYLVEQFGLLDRLELELELDHNLFLLFINGCNVSFVFSKCENSM